MALLQPRIHHSDRKINKDTENTEHTIRKQCIKWHMIPDVLKRYP